MFLAPFFFGGGAPPEFLESIDKIDTGSDHVAKFRSDRRLRVEKKKTSRAKWMTSRSTERAA